MTDADVFSLIESAFAVVPRPAHFTDYWHCPECADHDQFLQSNSVVTLTVSPGWDPFYLVTPEGFRYYFPALVRLALTQRKEPYLPQFLCHIANPDSPLQHFSCFTQTQKEIVLTVLKHIYEQHSDMIVGWSETEEDLLIGIIQWEEFVKC